MKLLEDREGREKMEALQKKIDPLAKGFSLVERNLLAEYVMVSARLNYNGANVYFII